MTTCEYKYKKYKCTREPLPNSPNNLCKKNTRKIGNRELADHYFYREMEAKRKQLLESEKKIKKLRGLIELPLQYVFGYGVHTFWVFGWWWLVVFLCALIYAFGNGKLPVEYTYFSILTAANPGYGAILFNYIYWFGNQLEKTLYLGGYLWKCFYFSTVSAATPGYGGYSPRPGFEILAAFEAVFGAFMWAAFIATFARKYMRAYYEFL